MIGFIGLGNMGTALFKKIHKSKNEFLDSNEVITYLYDKNSKQLKSLVGKNVQISSSLEELFSECKYIFVAIKPKDFVNLAETIKRFIRSEHVLISVIAGIKLASLEAFTKGENSQNNAKNWIRVMPNTPCLVGRGVGAIVYPEKMGDLKKKIVSKWFESLGFFYQIKESEIDVVTALTGAGPAFVFTYIQVLVDAGVKRGMNRELALKSVVEMIKGSCELVIRTQKHPTVLRDEVSSPGGVTIEGLLALTEAGFEQSIHKGIDAAYEKSITMSKSS